METNQFLYPCFVLFLLQATTVLVLLVSRVLAVRKGVVEARYFKTYDMPIQLPRQMVATARNFSNQFEVPIHFLVVVLLLLHFDLADQFQLNLAWAFVGSRVLHTLIHITVNKIPLRMLAYSAGQFILMAMWIHLLF